MKHLTEIYKSFAKNNNDLQETKRKNDNTSH